MPITPESMLGPYRIAGIIGEGGMGVVYRAKDTRLGRDVAIKVLTHVAIEDQERLQRFEQEARATGILNHPNLLTIYDVGAGSLTYHSFVVLPARFDVGPLSHRPASSCASPGPDEGVSGRIDS